MRHNSSEKNMTEMLRIEVPERVLIVNDLLNDSCTKHLMFCWNQLHVAFFCLQKKKNEQGFF